MPQSYEPYIPSEARRIQEHLERSLADIRSFFGDILSTPLSKLLDVTQHSAPKEPEGNPRTPAEYMAQLFCENFEKLVDEIRAEAKEAKYNLSDDELLRIFPFMNNPDSATPWDLLSRIRNRNEFFESIQKQLEGLKNDQTHSRQDYHAQQAPETIEQFLEDHGNTPLCKLLSQTQNLNEPLDNANKHWQSILRDCPKGFIACIHQLPASNLSGDRFRSNLGRNYALKKSISKALQYWQEQLHQYQKATHAEKLSFSTGPSENSADTAQELTRISSIFSGIASAIQEETPKALRPKIPTRGQSKDELILDQIREELCGAVKTFIALKLQTHHADLLSIVQAYYCGVRKDKTQESTDTADVLQYARIYLSLNELLDAQHQRPGSTRSDTAVEVCLQAIIEEISAQTGGHISDLSWSTLTLDDLYCRIEDWETLEHAIRERLDPTVVSNSGPELTLIRPSTETNEITPAASAILEQEDIPAVHRNTEYPPDQESAPEDALIRDPMILARKPSISSSISEDDLSIDDIPADAATRIPLAPISAHSIAQEMEIVSAAATHATEEPTPLAVEVATTPKGTHTKRVLNTSENTKMSDSHLVMDKERSSPHASIVSQHAFATNQIPLEASPAQENSMEGTKPNAVPSDEGRSMPTEFKTEQDIPATKGYQSAVYSSPAVAPAVGQIANADVCEIDATANRPSENGKSPPTVSTSGNIMQEASRPKDRPQEAPSGTSLESLETAPTPLLADSFSAAAPESTEHHATEDTSIQTGTLGIVMPVSTTPTEDHENHDLSHAAAHTNMHPVDIRSKPEAEDLRSLTQHTSDTDVCAILPMPTSSHSIQDCLEPCAADNTKNNEETMKPNTEYTSPMMEPSQTDAPLNYAETTASASDQTTASGDASPTDLRTAEKPENQDFSSDTDTTIDLATDSRLQSPDEDSAKIDRKALEWTVPSLLNRVEESAIDRGPQEDQDIKSLVAKIEGDLECMGQLRAQVAETMATIKAAQRNTSVETPGDTHTSTDCLHTLELLMQEHEQIERNLKKYRTKIKELDPHNQDAELALHQMERRVLDAEQAVEDLQNIEKLPLETPLDKQKSSEQCKNTESQLELQQTLVELKDALNATKAKLSEQISGLSEQLRSQPSSPLHDTNRNADPHTLGHMSTKQTSGTVELKDPQETATDPAYATSSQVEVNNNDAGFQSTNASDRIGVDSKKDQAHIMGGAVPKAQQTSIHDRPPETETVVHDHAPANTTDRGSDVSDQSRTDGLCGGRQHSHGKAEVETGMYDDKSLDEMSDTDPKTAIPGGAYGINRGSDTGAPPAYSDDSPRARACQDFGSILGHKEGYGDDTKTSLGEIKIDLYRQAQTLLQDQAQEELAHVLITDAYEPTESLKKQLRLKITRLLQSDFERAYQAFQCGPSPQSHDSGVESGSASPGQQTPARSAHASCASSPSKSSSIQSKTRDPDESAQRLIKTLYLAASTNSTEEQADPTGEQSNDDTPTTNTLLEKTLQIATGDAEDFIADQKAPTAEKLEKTYSTNAELLPEAQRELALAQRQLTAQQLKPYLNSHLASIRKVQNQNRIGQFSEESQRLQAELETIQSAPVACCPLIQDRHTRKRRKNIQHAMEHVVKIQNDHAAVEDYCKHLAETAEALQSQLHQREEALSSGKRQIFMPLSANWAYMLVKDPNHSTEAEIDQVCEELYKQLSSNAQNLLLSAKTALYERVPIQADQILMVGARIQQTRSQAHTLIMKMCVGPQSDRFYIHSLDQKPAHKHVGFFEKRIFRKPDVVDTVAKLTLEMIQSSQGDQATMFAINLKHPSGLDCLASVIAFSRLHPGTMGPHHFLQSEGLDNETTGNTKKHKAFMADLESRIEKKTKEFQNQVWQAPSDASADLNNTRTNFRKMGMASAAA